jgi:hypothetical protein
MSPSQAFDPDLHREGSPAAAGRCTHHQPGDESCTGEAEVSYQDADGEWQAGCAAALEELVESGRIEPLGQGA